MQDKRTKSQIHIRFAGGVEDKARVEQILRSAEMKFSMLDTTVTSRVPDTIACFSETPAGGFAIGARVVGGIIIIDTFDGRESSPRYFAAKEHLAAESRRIFGERCFMPTKSEFIPPDHSLPHSPEALAFAQKHLKINKPAD